MTDDTRCAVEGCEKPRSSRGWCDMHYRRWRTTGDPMAIKQRSKIPEEERFWAKVDAMGVCWEWTAKLDKDGYGCFKFSGRDRGAHRISYELLVGNIQEGFHLDHLCRNRACVNPDHLEPVTPRENSLRGKNGTLGAHGRKEYVTQCKSGHKYTNDNIYTIVDKNGVEKRRCVTCRKARKREYNERVRCDRNAS